MLQYAAGTSRAERRKQAEHRHPPSGDAGPDPLSENLQADPPNRDVGKSDPKIPEWPCGPPRNLPSANRSHTARLPSPCQFSFKPFQRTVVPRYWRALDRKHHRIFHCAHQDAQRIEPGGVVRQTILDRIENTNLRLCQGASMPPPPRVKSSRYGGVVSVCQAEVRQFPDPGAKQQACSLKRLADVSQPLIQIRSIASEVLPLLFQRP